jgi:hypothetical protein
MTAAIISPCGQYRYTLHRTIPSVLRWVKPCLFIMLNPSIADATIDDPTIRRCIGFAKREGCTSLTVVNLFALRATDPQALAKHADPFGPDNAMHVGDQMFKHRIGLVIAAWGAHPMATDSLMASTLGQQGVHCLGMTKDGHPRHPLYVKGDQPLVPWSGK